LDVKVGAGAFMKNEEKARELARAMVEIGRQVGRKTVAVISDMNQPLGHAVGNALEIVEAVQTLQGKGPQDLTHLCLTLGSHMVVLAGKAADTKEARHLLEEKMNNGQALQKLADLVQHQGGRAEQVFDTGQLPQAKYRVDIPAESEGAVQAIDAQEIGTLAMTLGAGRATKESVIDLAVGIVLHKKVGDNVSRGEALATLHMNDEQHKSLAPRLMNAYSIDGGTAIERPLIYKEIT
jgi:pyrimidine-nucleoside phosphorylase